MDIEELKKYLKSFSMVGAFNSVEELQRDNQLLRHEQLQLTAAYAEDIASLKQELEVVRKDALRYNKLLCIPTAVFLSMMDKASVHPSYGGKSISESIDEHPTPIAAQRRPY